MITISIKDLNHLNDEESDFIFGHELGHADFFEKFPYNKYISHSIPLISLSFLNKKTIIFAPLIFGINVLNNLIQEFYADLFSVQFFTCGKNKNTSFLDKVKDQEKTLINHFKQNDKFVHPSPEYRKYVINNFDLNQNLTILNIFKSILNI